MGNKGAITFNDFVGRLDPSLFVKEVEEIVEDSLTFIEEIADVIRIPENQMGYSFSRRQESQRATVISELTSIPISWDVRQEEKLIVPFMIGSNFGVSEKTSRVMSNEEFARKLRNHTAAVETLKQQLIAKAALLGSSLSVIGSGPQNPYTGVVEPTLEDFRQASDLITSLDKGYVPSKVLVNPVDKNKILTWDFFTKYEISGEPGGIRRNVIGDILGMSVVVNRSVPAGKIIVLSEREMTRESPIGLVISGQDLYIRTFTDDNIFAQLFPVYAYVAPFVRDGEAICIIDLYDSPAYEKLVQPAQTPYRQNFINEQI